MRRGKLIIALISGTMSVESYAKTKVEAWGRAGVSFQQYRADAIECAKIGYFRDVSKDDPAKRFVRGWQTADDSLNLSGPSGADWNNVVLRTQPDRQKKLVHAIQVGDVETCLLDKGYRKFALSREEERQLKRYPAGSSERHRYLHSLAAAQRPA